MAKKKKTSPDYTKVTVKQNNTKIYGVTYNEGDVVEVKNEHLDAVLKLNGSTKVVCVNCKKCKTCK